MNTEVQPRSTGTVVRSPLVRRTPVKTNPNVMSDVRRFIPDTDQTNVNAFPAYEFQEFPKMMLGPDAKPYIDEASGQPVTVMDEDEELTFREHFPDALVTVPNNSALNASERAELEQLRATQPKEAREDDEGDEPKVNRLSGLTASKPRPPAPKPQRKGQQLKSRSGAPLPRSISSKD